MERTTGIVIEVKYKQGDDEVNKDPLAASLQAAMELKLVEDACERAKQAKQDALATQNTTVNTSLQAQIEDWERVESRHAKRVCHMHRT